MDSKTDRRRWLTLFVSSWLLSAVICGALLFTPGYESDVQHYKQWARHLALNGVESAYAGIRVHSNH